MTVTDLSASRGQELRLPPGPRLPAWLQTLLFTLARHRLYPAMRRKYGDTFLLKPTAPYRHMVVLGRPEDIKTVFAGAPDVYHAGEGNSIMRPAMGDHSVLLTDEDEHKRTRRLLAPAFTGRALDGYREMVTERTRHAVSRWPVGQPLSALDRMQELMLEVIVSVVLGVTSRERLTQLRPAIHHITGIDPVTLMGLHYPRLHRLPPWRTHLRHQRKFDEITYAEIAERRASGSYRTRHDVLSRLMQVSDGDSGRGLDDVELRDNIISVLLAGHDTTAAGLAWALHELVRNPEQLAAAQQAALDNDDDYLAAVAKETLRIKPVINDVARQLTEPVRIGEYHLPAGITVLPAIALVHADPARHTAPTEFEPSRFLGQQPEANTWIPFGGGARRCIGALFAVMEMTIVLKTVLQTYDLRPHRRAPETRKAKNIITVPARGGRIIATRRSDSKKDHT
ncbi:cytochrome P450 [Mycobacterium sp. 134]|uniref:cytochrome P450 n=1 Tax=unclassified Mycobacterium TaxID=2642494 RepID=UPI0008003214|nr:cytochrome P450 [Mycobacterium sp. E802]OBG83430.1 cytochrome P450 [Mycobacterium sp. E802]